MLALAKHDDRARPGRACRTAWAGLLPEEAQFFVYMLSFAYMHAVLTIFTGSGAQAFLGIAQQCVSAVLCAKSQMYDLVVLKQPQRCDLRRRVLHVVIWQILCCSPTCHHYQQ
jgi:hypothetical protein